MGWLQKMAVSVLVSFLQSSVKNPSSLAKEYEILRQVRDLINQILPPNT